MSVMLQFSSVEWSGHLVSGPWRHFEKLSWTTYTTIIEEDTTKIVSPKKKNLPPPNRCYCCTTKSILTCCVSEQLIRKLYHGYTGTGTSTENHWCAALRPGRHLKHTLSQESHQHCLDPDTHAKVYLNFSQCYRAFHAETSRLRGSNTVSKEP